MNKAFAGLALTCAAFFASTAHAVGGLTPLAEALPPSSSTANGDLVDDILLAVKAGGVGAHRAPKDLVALPGYSDKLFGAFAGLPAEKTQVSEFAACDGTPVYLYRVSKGHVPDDDWEATDIGWRAVDLAQLAKKDSRALLYVRKADLPGELAHTGLTLYSDFLKSDPRAAVERSQLNLRIGLLQDATIPQSEVTRCEKLDPRARLFPDSLVVAARAGALSLLKDETGDAWRPMRAHRSQDLTLETARPLTSLRAARTLFEKGLQARIAGGAQPAAVSRMSILKGDRTTVSYCFAVFKFKDGRTEFLFMTYRQGSAVLTWTVS
ncbi:hypothetical protein F6X40_10235 [Paraburkholderia sp. UCT31]|uniref:hypothetical protein n=1 Tax=Paraburkholderia sp. UCT31 TaxID=2615209 RepID=UPI001655BED0|nr:hypothetical protein [Paraburkholderia sp. UCT31]MBC8737186.1 hypothetical protein [Paraburkholderia sp. UCT31]